MLTINKASTYAAQVSTNQGRTSLISCAAAALRSTSCAIRPPLQLQLLSCAVRPPLPLRLLTCAVRPPQLLPLMLSPGAPTSVPAGTPSVTPTVVPALRVFARRLIVVFVRRHALATRALRPHAFWPQCRCGCPRTRSAVRAPAVSALALSLAAATGRHCRGGRARQG